MPSNWDFQRHYVAAFGARDGDGALMFPVFERIMELAGVGPEDRLLNLQKAVRVEEIVRRTQAEAIQQQMKAQERSRGLRA